MIGFEPPDDEESFETALTPIAPPPANRSIPNGMFVHNGSSHVSRTLPHSLEAEEYLLSSILIDGDATIDSCIASNVASSSFYDPKHSIVYEELLQMRRASKPIDVATLAEELKDHGTLDTVGGYPFIAQVSSRIPTTAQTGYFIKKVADLATKREIIRVATSAVEDCYSHAGADISDLTSDLTRRLTFAVSGIPSATAGKTPFTLWAPSQFIAYVPDPSSCLLGTGYLELGQWTSFVGIGGLGKTRLALWMVICQMLKKPWCDLPTGGVPQKSIILSTENGLKRWKDDLTKILSTLTEPERAVVEGNLRILAMTDDEDGDICLGDPANVTRLKATLLAATPGIVVFDPFADMMDGDENKTVDLVATLTLLRSITRTTCPKAAILIIHHARTGSANVAQAGDNFNAGNFGRGAKALFSKVRCEIQLAPEDRDNTDRLVLACGKSNDSAKFAPRCVVFNPSDFTYSIDPSFDIDAWRDDVSGNRKKSTVSIADIVNAVHEKCPLQGDEISSNDIFEEFEESGVTKRTLQRHVANAIEAGYLRIGKKRFMLKLGSKPLPV